jgi:radical SAM superfamily enzyme YgiQ (UPF0313 family)
MKKLKIHFVVPPTKGRIPDRIFGCNYGLFMQQNIFVLYPATVLKKAGYDVEVTDCIIDNKTLRELTGDIFVFYSVFLSRDIDLRAARFLSKKGKTIVFIGSDPTSKPENYVLEKNYFVCRGEPEYVLLDFVKKFRKKDFSKLKGLSWLKKGKVVHNKVRPYIKDINKIPIPDRNLMKNQYRYFNAKFKKLPTTTMVTSRGCAFRCIFCVPNSQSFARELEWRRWYGKKPPVGLRSPEDIEKEIKEIVKLGYKSIFILDDEFIWGEERIIKILDNIKKYGLEISLLARCDMLTKRIAEKFKEAGVSHVDLGVESFNQDILNYVRKNQDVKTIKRAVNYLKDVGIEPEINILLGSCPLETKETMENTLKKAEKLNVEIIHTKICAPFPGTEFNKMAKEKGWMTVPEYIPIDPASQSLISYPHLSGQEMVKAVKRFYRKHYFSPRYLLKQLLNLKSFSELKNKMKTAISIQKTIIMKK